jgi:hypothetical protein
MNVFVDPIDLEFPPLPDNDNVRAPFVADVDDDTDDDDEVIAEFEAICAQIETEESFQ